MAAARRFREQGVTAIGVCFLHSYADPAHEPAMREVLRREHPEAVVSLSREALREYREYERAVTTPVDAAVKPTMRRYIDRIARRPEPPGPPPSSVEREVETAVARTARSPMIRDAHDFRAGVRDRRPRKLVGRSCSAPAHPIVRDFPIETMRPGDVSFHDDVHLPRAAPAAGCRPEAAPSRSSTGCDPPAPPRGAAARAAGTEAGGGAGVPPIPVRRADPEGRNRRTPMARSARRPPEEATMATVTLAQARAHVSLKQGLAGEGLGSVPEVLDATGGIYGTAPTCYLSCAARIPSFRLADLDRELYAERGAVRLRAMRGMTYIEPLPLLPALLACTGEPRDRTLRRISKHAGMTEAQTLELADRIEAALAGRPPMTVQEIRRALGGDLPGGSGALQMTVALLARYGRIVRATVRGSWRSDLYSYARWSDWLGAPAEEMDPAEARVEVARRYLRAYGPATAADLAWWSGWTKRDTLSALAALGEETTPVSLDGGDALVLTDELDALTSLAPEDGRGVRLLPVWDCYFMGYATGPEGRVRQVRPRDYPRVYDGSGNATSVVVRDGTAAGVWELDADAGVVTVAPFDDGLPWDEVAARIEALGRAIGVDLRMERAPAPGPLSEGPRNTFLSPISLRS
mgnify:CR=1 FL=1